VEIDKSGRDYQPGRIDYAFGVSPDSAYRRDPALPNSDISSVGWNPRTVNYSTIAD
jgi:hypothetical protein